MMNAYSQGEKKRSDRSSGVSVKPHENVCDLYPKVIGCVVIGCLQLLLRKNKCFLGTSKCHHYTMTAAVFLYSSRNTSVNNILLYKLKSHFWKYATEICTITSLTVTQNKLETQILRQMSEPVIKFE